MSDELETIVVTIIDCLSFRRLDRCLCCRDTFLLKLVSDRNVNTSGGKLVNVHTSSQEPIICDLGLGRFGEFLEESRLLFAALNL